MTRAQTALIAAAVVLLAAVGLAYEIAATGPVRGAVRTCSELLSVANRPGMKREERLAAARSLCSHRYLATHKLDVAGSGEGLVGVPRNLHKNFKGWREGPYVWICTTNRVGPIYQFVNEDGAWRFDGPVGILRPWGEIIPMTDEPGSD
jgi:hypothetical protein